MKSVRFGHVLITWCFWQNQALSLISLVPALWLLFLLLCFVSLLFYFGCHYTVTFIHICKSYSTHRTFLSFYYIRSSILRFSYVSNPVIVSLLFFSFLFVHMCSYWYARFGAFDIQITMCSGMIQIIEIDSKPKLKKVPSHYVTLSPSLMLIGTSK